jgi:DNA polymerase III alpha subunit (gram-positive type)
VSCLNQGFLREFTQIRDLQDNLRLSITSNAIHGDAIVPDLLSATTSSTDVSNSLITTSSIGTLEDAANMTLCRALMQQSNQAHAHRLEMLTRTKEANKKMDEQAKRAEQALTEQRYHQKETEKMLQQKSKVLESMQQQLAAFEQSNQSLKQQRSEEGNRLAAQIHNFQLEQRQMAQDNAREQDRLINIINNNNNQDDRYYDNSSNTRDSYNTSNHSNTHHTQNLFGRGGGGDGGPRGPPPPKPVYRRMNPKSKNLHMAAEINEENRRKDQAYQRRLDAYYGVTK